MSSVAGRVLMLFKGDYDSSVTYNSLDVVLYQGLSYVAKGTTTGNAPSNTTYWQKLLDMPTQVDNVPTQNSDNLVKSGGVYSALSDKADASTAYSTSDSSETIADADYIPFYDTSASAKKKTLWSSLVSAVTAVFTGASASTAGTKGTVPAPAAGDEGKFLKGNGTWANPPSPSVMTGADGTNAGTSGLVPAPAATDNTKFFRGDGTYQSVPLPSDMVGATSQANGTHGLAPAPTTTDVNKFLKGDGTYGNETWANVQSKPFSSVDNSYTGYNGVYSDGTYLITTWKPSFVADTEGTNFKCSLADNLVGVRQAQPVPGSAYVEKSVTLSTSTTTTVTFQELESLLPGDATYDVSTSVYGLNPESVEYTSIISSGTDYGVLTIVLPKVATASTITVRVHIKYAYDNQFVKTYA